MCKAIGQNNKTEYEHVDKPLNMYHVAMYKN